MENSKCLAILWNAENAENKSLYNIKNNDKESSEILLTANCSFEQRSFAFVSFHIEKKQLNILLTDTNLK